jgi:SNF2 family DNA or RNA helicase
MLELVGEYARIKFGPGSFELTVPDTPAAARYAAVQRFNAAGAAGAASTAKHPFLYLITPKSIGLGTQLPGLSAAIIVESDYHPRLDIQAIHRARAAGAGALSVFRLLLRLGVEERLLQLADRCVGWVVGWAVGGAVAVSMSRFRELRWLLLTAAPLLPVCCCCHTGASRWTLC